MTPHILVTGAAGYIGGSIVADFISTTSLLHRKVKITAATRSQEQADALSKLGVDVLLLDLANEADVIDSIVRQNIDIVIHTAGSINPTLPKNLITGLGRQKDVSGKKTYFIHTSGLGAFSPNNGWPSGDFNDTDEVFETEKKLADSFPLRRTDVDVIEHAKNVGVTSYVVVPSMVYGRGTGPWNQLSILLPVFISAAISRKVVSVFAENTKVSAVHISDVTRLYSRIVEKILDQNPPDSGEKGYYFGIAHDTWWHEIADHVAATLDTRGLVSTKQTRVWSSDAEAADALGVPELFAQALWNSGADIIAHNETRLGWEPAWTREKYLAKIDEEVQDVIELGKAKSSLIDSLHKAVSG